jgi:hypothetical protein
MRHTHNKTKTKRQGKSKTCKQFCKDVIIPERERVQIEFDKKNNTKVKYRPIKMLRKMKKIELANTIETMYLKNCNEIYCQKSCNGNKQKWVKSFTKKRKDTLIQQGALSGCRDLQKEFPKVYKNV